MNKLNKKQLKNKKYEILNPGIVLGGRSLIHNFSLIIYIYYFKCVILSLSFAILNKKLKTFRKFYIYFR